MISDLYYCFNEMYYGIKSDLECENLRQLLHDLWWETNSIYDVMFVTLIDNIEDPLLEEINDESIQDT